MECIIKVLYMPEIIMSRFTDWQKNSINVQQKKDQSEVGRIMQNNTVGIITFHCSDNYGAILQAYGLKMYLCGQGMLADIVPYEPFFMVGRNWLLPCTFAGDLYRSLRYSCWGICSHIKMGRDFFHQKSKMKCFREKYLVEKKRKKMRWSSQMRRLCYQYYIVGSDQIWNPDITFGLRKVYFGGFKNRYKKKVVAYAASIGGSTLLSKYGKQFSQMMNYIDVVSVREKDAVPYVEKYCDKKVSVMLDPVFLLGEEFWREVEVLPEKTHYILVYPTEVNQEMIHYVKMLSEKTGLQVIELRSNYRGNPEKFIVDYTAGPSEFLGYIHNADYVISNSFHAVAFSIIFEKHFAAFLHSNRGTRVKNILEVCDLTDRLYQEDTVMDIGREIIWKEVKENLRREVKCAQDFLREHLSKG